jgi:hypothetical protein
MLATGFVVPAAAILAAAALAACSSSATPSANTAATITPSVLVASAAASTATSGAPQTDACKTLAATTFDASTGSKIATTQDQIVAALNPLPKHDRFAADVLAKDQDLVALSFDLVGEEAGDDTGTAPYNSDATKLHSALNTVESDCATLGVPFTATLRLAPLQASATP